MLNGTPVLALPSFRIALSGIGPLSISMATDYASRTLLFLLYTSEALR